MKTRWLRNRARRFPPRINGFFSRFFSVYRLPTSRRSARYGFRNEGKVICFSSFPLSLVLLWSCCAACFIGVSSSLAYSAAFAWDMYIKYDETWPAVLFIWSIHISVMICGVLPAMVGSLKIDSRIFFHFEQLICGIVREHNEISNWGALKYLCF